MEELQVLGYKMFAYGFLIGDVQIPFTTNCVRCTEPVVADAMRSLVVVGELHDICMMSILSSDV